MITGEEAWCGNQVPRQHPEITLSIVYLQTVEEGYTDFGSPKAV